MNPRGAWFPGTGTDWRCIRPTNRPMTGSARSRDADVPNGVARPAPRACETAWRLTGAATELSMIPRTLLATARIPDTDKVMQLYRSGDLFSIKIPGRGDL